MLCKNLVGRFTFVLSACMNLITVAENAQHTSNKVGSTIDQHDRESSFFGEHGQYKFKSAIILSVLGIGRRRKSMNCLRNSHFSVRVELLSPLAGGI